jgi:hypothetical protein
MLNGHSTHDLSPEWLEWRRRMSCALLCPKRRDAAPSSPEGGTAAQQLSCIVTPGNRETRLRLVEALAPTIAGGLSGRRADSVIVDNYFSEYGAMVDRLQAIVERASAKEETP